MKTRRSFLAMLVGLLPASMLALLKKPEGKSTLPVPKDEMAEAFKKYYDETEINAKPQWLGRNDVFYDLYVDTATGEFVDGNEVRLFLDWTPFTPDRPRYAQMRRHVFGGPDDKFPSSWELKTYLDTGLYPVLPGFGTCKNSPPGHLHPKYMCDEYHHSIHGLVQEPDWKPFMRVDSVPREVYYK